MTRTDDLWIVVPNWDKFQHYRDRRPTWIKLYLDLSSKDEWRELTLAERGLLVSLWLEYCTASAQLRHGSVTRRIGATARKEHFESLQAKGFIQLSASKPVSIRYQAASPETEKEKERPSKGSKEQTQNRLNRQRAEAWIRNGLAHEIPDERLATVIQDEFRITDPTTLEQLVDQARNGTTDNIPY